MESDCFPAKSDQCPHEGAMTVLATCVFMQNLAIKVATLAVVLSLRDECFCV